MKQRELIKKLEAADIVQKAVFALAKWQYILYIEIVKATENRKYEHTKAEDSFKPQLSP